MTTFKQQVLSKLAQKRQLTRWDGYLCIADLHGGAYECDQTSYSLPKWVKITYRRIHSTGHPNCRLTGQLNCRLTAGSESRLMIPID